MCVGAHCIFLFYLFAFSLPFFANCFKGMFDILSAFVYYIMLCIFPINIPLQQQQKSFTVTRDIAVKHC